MDVEPLNYTFGNVDVYECQCNNVIARYDADLITSYEGNNMKYVLFKEAFNVETHLLVPTVANTLIKYIYCKSCKTDLGIKLTAAAPEGSEPRDDDEETNYILDTDKLKLVKGGGSKRQKYDNVKTATPIAAEPLDAYTGDVDRYLCRDCNNEIASEENLIQKYEGYGGMKYALFKAVIHLKTHSFEIPKMAKTSIQFVYCERCKKEDLGFKLLTEAEPGNGSVEMQCFLYTDKLKFRKGGQSGGSSKYHAERKKYKKTRRTNC